MCQRMTDERGLTLVELLTVFVTVTIFSVIIYQVLINGINAYSHIDIEAKLRDEADIIMAELINDLYLLKQSSIKETYFPEEGTNNYYFKLDDGKIVGFYDQSIYLTTGETIALRNESISLHENSKIVLKNNRNGLYKILLTLQYDDRKNNHTLTTESEVSILMNH